MTRLDSCSVTGGACGSDAPAIEVRGLSFTYPRAEAPVLDRLDWSVPQGAFALLVGGTGSGKSTLLSLLKPEISPTGECAGELRVLGESVADMDVRTSAERVGYVFQDPENQIVCETVWHEMAFGLENLGLARDEMRRRVAETSYFFGLEDWLHRDTDTLSGGRKQLLSLAGRAGAAPARAVARRAHVPTRSRCREKLPACAVSREPRAGLHGCRGNAPTAPDARIRDVRVPD